MLTLEDVRAARVRIGDEIVHTPCKRSHAFEGQLPCKLHLKLENLQRTGSFKDRGALNKLLQLSPEECQRGVVTASAGNHAQALAFHAELLGIPATVVMPEFSPLIKVANTRKYGARVIQKGATLSDGIHEVERLREEEDLTLVHAFDDAEVIAGQGTIGLELVEQVPDLTTIVVPIGGGGVISGIATVVKELMPTARVIGVEAEAAPSAKASLAAGAPIRIETHDTLADGIAVKRIGDLTFPIVRDLVDDVVTVSDDEIADAILHLLEREKTVVEGAGAAPLAALLSGRIPVTEDDVVVAVLCGGNIDVNMLSRIIDRGLVDDGRLARLIVKVPDRPGALRGLTDVAAEHGANVLEVSHHREFADISVGEVEIAMHLETRGREHVEELIDAFKERAYRVREDD